jgi:hypothetical protein
VWSPGRRGGARGKKGRAHHGGGGFGDDGGSECGGGSATCAGERPRGREKGVHALLVKKSENQGGGGGDGGHFKPGARRWGTASEVAPCGR